MATEVALLDNPTVIPPEGAGPFSVTVPTELLPPATLVGFSVNPVSATGTNVKLVLNEFKPNVAVIVTVVVLFTQFVGIAKSIDDAPAGTVTVDGGRAFPLFEVRFMTTPLAEAGALSVTVPTVEFPPAMELGLIASPVSEAAEMDSVAEADVTPTFAVITADVSLATFKVVIVNVAEVEPAATVTVAGGMALVKEEVNDTI